MRVELVFRTKLTLPKKVSHKPAFFFFSLDSNLHFLHHEIARFRAPRLYSLENESYFFCI